MQALNAALAFGITMFVLATVVSSLVETLHRLFGLREKGLAFLVGNFYDRVIAMRATDITRGGEDRRRFIDMMTANRGPLGSARMPAFLARLLRPGGRLGDLRFLNWIWSGRRLGSLDVTGFMERLGGSDYGASLAMQASGAGGSGTAWMLKDLAQKFGAYGSEASEYFESRARLLSVIVGFVIAFAVNVNVFVLVQTFMTRPEVTQAVIDRQDEIEKGVQNFQARIDALNAAIDRAQQVAGSGGAAAPAETAALRQELQETRAAMNEAKDATRASLGTLTDAGVPLGWQSFAQFTAVFASLTALTGLALGGLLIGLGAPFWYKIIQNLTAIRALAGSGKDSEKGPATGAPAPPAGPTQTPTTPIEAFHAALGARLAAGDLCAPEEAVG